LHYISCFWLWNPGKVNKPSKSERAYLTYRRPIGYDVILLKQVKKQSGPQLPEGGAQMMIQSIHKELHPSRIPITSLMLLLIASFTLAACATSAPSTPWVVELLSPQGYEAQFGADQQHLLIDVRTPEEFASGHIEGAVNIPVEELSQRLGEVTHETPLVVYCRTGNRSATAAQILVNAGYGPVFNLGGIQSWIAAGYPVVD
jgi:phage shock protein E